MPHSVLCDLVQGEGSLQFASEDAMSQRQLLSCKLHIHRMSLKILKLTYVSQCSPLTTKLGHLSDSPDLEIEHHTISP